jgi:hypothetical protein
MKPVLNNRDPGANGSCHKADLSETIRELKQPIKNFLETKYALLSRARRNRLIRAGLAPDPGASIHAGRNSSSKAS